MKKITALLKKLRLQQIVTVFFAGLLLIVSTACSSGDVTGANPQNPAVQAGGANNPYKNGGDKYTRNPSSNSQKIGNQANLPSGLLIATNQESEILYPGAETPQGRVEKEKELPIITKENFKTSSEPGSLIQNESDLGNRVQDRLETVKEQFEDATSFVKDKAAEASARPELQKNPAVGR
ncbi:hypothetical protein NIES21_54070 [Anabaenopsis circularis NIES-21]|jgi:hypothetical protein|uniref:Lipoprotein n=2 Tax=Nostocales TaxID=1161 RepID=A0A1Z4GPW7_9CYAN|nr:DUF6658 family protein [Nostoc cycadae]BAY19544.1 hypothetical protein NIES21_54070 [Anabaenopsis circularis NIES-21]GBE93414.1 hypothetical protein NCWK1_3176 [Nostoc cycadae WK-1]